MPQKKRGPKSPMSSEHKEALALGREQGRAVRQYLEAVERHKPKRGRKRTPDSIKKRLAAIENELSSADPLSRVRLFQERRDLSAELNSKQEGVDLSALEKGFIAAAKPYSERKGIGYAAWREAGVDPAVLKKAGITRGS
jgi:hypothetical protein